MALMSGKMGSEVAWEESVMEGQAQKELVKLTLRPFSTTTPLVVVTVRCLVAMVVEADVLGGGGRLSLVLLRKSN